jgi:hypothetical protein
VNPEPAPAAPLSAEELRREIDRTREDLGQTVAALMAKVDVKQRARIRVRRWRAQLASDPAYALGLAAVVGAAIAAVCAALVIGRRPSG